MRIQRWSTVSETSLPAPTPARGWPLAAALVALWLLPACDNSSACGSGDEMVNGQCVPACEDGEVWINDACRPECPEGQDYVGNACMAPSCEGDTELVDGMCQTEFDVTPMVVRLNSVGFIPDRVKLAAVVGGTWPCSLASRGS